MHRGGAGFFCEENWGGGFFCEENWGGGLCGFVFFWGGFFFRTSLPRHEKILFCMGGKGFF